MGRLTTHVLDLAAGRPAADLAIRLEEERDGAWLWRAETRTDADGRAPAPLIEGADFTAGRYALSFEAGAYFDARGVATSEPKFLDTIVIRFGVADATQHYHVPLLLSPYGYSTYRGS